MNVEKFIDEALEERLATFFCRQSLIDLVRDAIMQDRKERISTFCCLICKKHLDFCECPDKGKATYSTMIRDSLRKESPE